MAVVAAVPRVEAQAAPRNFGDQVLRVVLRAAALVLVLLVLAMVAAMVHASWPAMRAFGWRPPTPRGGLRAPGLSGASPCVSAPLLPSLLALSTAAPLGTGGAFFPAGRAPAWFRPPIAFLVELVAAVPSVIYGLWGIFVLAPL